MNLPRISNLRLRTKILLACVVFVAIGIIGPAILLPRFIDLEALKTRMSTQVNAKLEGKLQTDRLEWAWLPLPHLNLRNTRFANEETSLVAPMTKVYPDWFALFRGQVRIGKVVLVNPEVKVQRFPTALSEPPDPELAGLKVVIRNGSVQIAANSQWAALQSKDFSFKALNGSMAIGLAAVDFDLSGTPADGANLAVSGEYLREDSSYRLKFSCRNFNPHTIFRSFAQGNLTPADAPFNLKGSLIGQGFEKITGKIAGDSPCLLAFPKDKKILLNCGFFDLDFAKDGDDLRVTINQFEMRDPGLKLSGTIQRVAGNKEKPEPVWQIDLKGEDLDLTKIRAAVLAMWGDNYMAKETGKIVLGGTAGKAHYTFKGTTADFQYARKMHVTAEDIDASVMIPEGELLLTNVKGKMRIENGLLIVDGDQARMGNSRGSKGHMVLGLPDDDFTFTLDVDLDADLAELPDVLKRLIKHNQRFQDELAKFSGVSGRATGHLHLGDRLNDFKVALAVATMQGKGRYAPLAWDFNVDGGEMNIAPPQVQWRNVHGTYGPHVVQKTAGQVRWPDDIFLDVTQLEAVVAAKELEKENLSYFKEITGALHKNITRADGRIELHNTTISGKDSEPKLWKADADVLARNLAVETPFFPEPIKIQQGKGHISDTAITVSEASGSLFGDAFTLGASLTHQTFSSLRGKISLQGKVGQGLGQWLKDKQLVSPSLFPHLPFQVESLQIDLQDGKTLAKGLISPDAGIFSHPPKADFSLEFANDNPLKMSTHVFGGKEDATISINFLDTSREAFSFAWKGELSKQTVDQLLDRKGLLQGKIAGDFQLYLPQDQNKVAFTGRIDATNLRWFLDEKAGRFVDIQELRLTGVGKDLKVRRLACAFNDKESMVINGLVSRAASGLSLKLDLTSPALSRKTLLDLQESLKRIRDNRIKPSPEGEPSPPSWNITGTVVFDVARFTSGPKPGDSNPATLIWQPLQGEIRIHPQWKLSALINNGRLCCLDTTGEWFSTPELGTSHFTLNSACPTPPRFENVLPCLGYPQDIIEGEFSLNGQLEGKIDNWKDGHLQIDSHQGRILRMKLLSKIFSVVNITDLFSVGQGGNGGGMSSRGFPYSDLVLKAHVKDNELLIDEAVVRGEGLNLFAKGKMNLSTFDLDVVVMISPFKTLDAIVSKVPLVGKVIGGETSTLITFPVGVTGKASDPQVTLLPPSAVGEGLMNVVKRTLLLPFQIFSPILPATAPEPEKKP